MSSMEKTTLEKHGQTQTVKATQINVKRIVNNTFISLLGQAATWISTFGLMIAYGRYLSAAQFGELYLAMTFVALLATPITSGYDNQITRGIIEEPDEVSRYFSNVLLIKIVLWIGIYSLSFLISWLIGYSSEVRLLLAVFGISTLSGAILSTFAAFHNAYERAVYPVLGSVIEKIFSTTVGYIVLSRGGGVEMMALVLVIGSVTGGIWQGFWFFRQVKVKFSLDIGFIRKILRTNLPFLAYGLMGVIYYRVDTVLLSFLASSVVIGWYGASYRLFDTLGFIPSLVSTLLYPVFFKLAQASDEDLKAAIEKSVNYLLFLGVPIAITMIVAAPNIISFIYHQKDFIHADASLQALAPGLVFLYVNMAIGAILMSKKQDKKIPVMAAIAMVFNMSINLVLIPLYQHVGAAAATSLTELLLLVVCIIFIPKNLRPTGSLIVVGKTIAASLVMAVIIWLIHTLNILIILPVATVTYLVAATVLRVIPRSDLEQLYQTMRKKDKPTASPVYEMAGLDMQTTHKLPAIRIPVRTSVDQFITLQIPAMGKITRTDDDIQIDKLSTQLLPIMGIIPRTDADIQIDMKRSVEVPEPLPEKKRQFKRPVLTL